MTRKGSLLRLHIRPALPITLVAPIKVKVIPYIFVHRGLPVRKDTYPELSTCEVG